MIVSRELVLLAVAALVACDEVKPRRDGPVTGIDVYRGEQAAPDRPLGGEPARPTEKGVPPADRPRPGEPAPNPFPVEKGKITYYDATGDGACMFGPSPNDLMVGAMNKPQYLGSQACGACAKITGPKGNSITVRIVDLCPECLAGHIDLSQQAFALLADPVLGVVQVTWQYVPCNVTGPVAYRFKEGSSQWWTAIQVRNARYAIKSLEVKQKGAFVALPRMDYNYFVQGSGLGVGPYEIRVTDVLGHQLVDTNIALKVGQAVPGAAQFPP